MNIDSVNLHSCYSNYVFLHNFAWTNMNDFWDWLDEVRNY